MKEATASNYDIRDLNQADGIHPNGKGVAVMVQHLLPLVTEAMDRVAERGAT